jgi:GNS1/SUR4 family
MSILERLTQLLGDADGDGNPLLWRPHLPESIDGKPLVTKTSELFFDFPYERLPENQVVAFFMRPEAMVVMALFYLVSKEPLRVFKDVICFNPKSDSFKSFVAFHNLALAVFSAVTVWNSWAVVLSHLVSQGWFATYCDVGGTHWASGLGAWSTIFYISKYFEFIDTWILVLKGKKASFLQVYHHTGIVFCMWGGVVCQSAWLLFVVCLNSLIHTFMYTYFLIKTLYPNIEIKSAKHLTMAQIGQLTFGISCSLGFHVMGDTCDTPASRAMLLVLLAYGASLVGLFVAFAQKKYKKKAL